MKKRRGSTIFNKRHTIKEIDNECTSSSEDEPIGNPLNYMKGLVMNKVKTNPQTNKIIENEDEDGTSS